MAFLKSKLGIAVVVFVIGVCAVFLYRFSSPVAQPAVNSASQAKNVPDLPVAREINSIATYQTPGGTDKVRFTLTIDGAGAITAVKTTDALKGDATSENLEKFSKGLLLVVRGKKLSELKSIDRVGTSSLTTAAFNSVLPDLQEQI